MDLSWLIPKPPKVIKTPSTGHWTQALNLIYPGGFFIVLFTSLMLVGYLVYKKWHPSEEIHNNAEGNSKLDPTETYCEDTSLVGREN